MSDLGIVLRSLRRHAFSTTVTAALVAVSVAILLVLLSLRSAAQSSFRRGTGNMHLLLGADASPLVTVLNGVFYANPPQQPIPWTKYQQIRGSFPWEWAVPTQIGDTYRGAPVVATTPDFFSRFEPVRGQPWRFAAGGAFDASFEVVAGAKAAADHGLSIGDRLALTHGAWTGPGGHEHANHLYEVVGILEPTGSAHDRALFTDLDSSWILHAEDRHEREEGATDHAEGDGHADHDHHEHLSAADLTDEDRLITNILLRLPTRPGKDASAALQSQFDALRRDTAITVAMPADQIDKLFRIIGDLDALFVAMGVAVLVSSGVAILLALYNSMELRRRQVAVFRALGASRGRVFMLVLTESALIGVLGAVGGVGLSLIAGLAASAELRARVGLVIDAGLDARSTVLVAAGAVALAALAGIAPAILAYRTPVAEHLKPVA